MILRLNVLDGLTMVSENIDANYCMVELWVGRLKNFIVGVFLIVQSVKPLQQEFKHSSQVFRGGSSHKDIAKPIYNSGSNRYS